MIRVQNLISPREVQVLTLIAREKTSFEMGELLHISRETIKSHRKNLMKKLEVRNVAGLVRKGFELGILTLP